MIMRRTIESDVQLRGNFVGATDFVGRKVDPTRDFFLRIDVMWCIVA